MVCALYVQKARDIECVAMPQTTNKQIRLKLKEILEANVTNVGLVYDTRPLNLTRAPLPVITLSEGTTTYDYSNGNRSILATLPMNIDLWQGEFQANQPNNLNDSSFDLNVQQIENTIISWHVRFSTDPNCAAVQNVFLQNAAPPDAIPYVSSIIEPVAGRPIYIHKRVIITLTYRRQGL